MKHIPCAARLRVILMGLLALGLMGLPGRGEAAADLKISVSNAWSEDEPWVYVTAFTVENIGDEAATSVSVQIDAPPELAMGSHGFQVMWPDGSVEDDPDPANLFIEALPAGEWVTYQYSYVALSFDRFDVSARAEMAAPDPTPENNSLTVKIWPAAEFSCTMVAQPAEIPLYGTTTLEITCTNVGNMPAYKPSLALLLSRNSIAGRVPWEFVSGSGSQGHITNDSLGVALSGFELEPGETVTMSVELRALWPWELPITLDVRQDGGSYGSIYGFTTTSVNVVGHLPNFDLAASMKMSPSIVQPGGLLVQQMTVTNLGPDDATSVTLYTQVGDLTSQFGSVPDSASLYLEHIVDAGPWNTKIAGHGLYARLPFLAAGTSASVTLVMRVRESFSTTSLFHYCKVSSDWWFEGNYFPGWDGDIFNAPGANPYLANNEARQMLQVNLNGSGAHSDLEISSIAPTEAPVGQAYTYKIRARNNGPHPTTSAFISNVVSSNLNVVAVQADKGSPSVAGRFVALEDVPLNVGETATLNVTVVPGEAGSEKYTGSTASPAFDANLSNNFSDKQTEITVGGPLVYPEVPCIDQPDLVGKIARVSRKGKFKKKTGEWTYKVQAKVDVFNIGTGCAMDKSTVRLYLSTDPVLSPDDILLGGKQIKKLCPPKNQKKGLKPKKVSIKTKLAPGVNPVGCYIIAVVDADNAIPECDETNNIALSLN